MKRLTAALMVICLTAGTVLAADEKADVVVTANRDQREARTIPANVTVITADDITAAGYDNAVEALEGSGGVYFRSTSGNASQAEIGMRGFGENSHGRVLVLVDGVKLNRPDMASVNWLQIPLGNIDRIEVLRGANTAIYGDHAIAGVINVVTKKGTKDSAGSLFFQGGSFDTFTERAGFSSSSGSLLYNVNVGHESTDGYRERSAYEQFDAAGSATWDLSDNLSASLALSGSKLDYEIPSGLTKAEMDADRRQSVTTDDSAENTYLNADAGMEADFDRHGRAGLNVSFGRKDIESDMASWFSYVDVVIDTYGVAPRYMLDSDIGSHANRFLVGADYYVDRLSIQRFSEAERITETSAADIDRTTLGFYIKDEFSITERWILGLGGRTETADIGGEMTGIFDDSKAHSQNAVDASITYLLGAKSKLFARSGTVYRFPFVDEQIAYWGFGSDQLYANIAAETGNNTELGGDFALSDSIRAGLTAFLLNMKNEIAYNAVTQQNENLDNTRRSGAEMELAWTATDWLTLDAKYAYTRAEFTAGPNDGNEIPLVPANLASLKAAFDLPRNFAFDTEARYVDPVWMGGDYANTAERLNNYTVVNVALRYLAEKAGRPDFHVGVDNVFDLDYASLGYLNLMSGETAYYPSAGRSFKAGVNWKF